MTTDNPQVPWTDEQWARVNKVVQEEASRARTAATFLPLLGPLPGDTDFVREQLIQFALPPRIACTMAQSFRNGPSPSIEKPNNLGSWLISTVSAMPFM